MDVDLLLEALRELVGPEVSAFIWLAGREDPEGNVPIASREFAEMLANTYKGLEDQ